MNSLSLKIKLILIFLFIGFKSYADDSILSNSFVTIGSNDAKVKIKIFSSLTCPHCADFHKKVVSEIRLSHSRIEQIENYQYLDNGITYENYKLAEVALAVRYSPKTLSLTTEEGIEEAKARLAALHPGILKSLELENITLFPKVAERLARKGITPRTIRHRGRIITLDTESGNPSRAG